MKTLFTIDCYEAATKALPVILEVEGLAIGLKAQTPKDIFNRPAGTATVEAFLFEEGGKLRHAASNGKGYTLLSRQPAGQLLADCRATQELDAAQLALFQAAINSLLA